MPVCSVCYTVQPLNNFFRRKDTKKGYRSQCKNCLKVAILRRPRSGAMIYCACNCGELLLDRDNRGRPRKFLRNHNWRVNEAFVEQMIKRQQTQSLNLDQTQPNMVPYSMRQYI